MIKKFCVLFISMVAIFVSATAVLADTSAVVGGEFQLKYTFPFDPTVGSDQTSVTWWEFDAIANKNFGDHATAYLKVKGNQGPSGQIPNSLSGVSLQLAGLGYTYKVNDKLSFTGRVDGDGEVLVDSPVMNDGYDWYYTLNDIDNVKMSMDNRVFVNRTEMKMDVTPLQGLNLTLGYVPKTLKEDNNRTGDEQYLIKAKYSGPWFNIATGYTNTRYGYEANVGYYNQYRPTYAVYGEVFPNPNLTLSGEYMEGNYYLVKGNARLEPVTLKVTYGNIGYSRTGHPTYLANSLDSELDYTFAANKTLITEAAYYLNTDYNGLAKATIGFTTGPLTVEAQRDFDKASIIPAPSTTLIGKYNLDGTNTLEANFNLDKKVYNLALNIAF